MSNILIVGATSAIAEAYARIHAERGDRLFVAGRDEDKLARVAADLAARGAAGVDTAAFDAGDPASLAALVEGAVAALGHIDVALIAHGSLPDQQACEASADAARAELETNALSVIDLLTRLAPVFEAQAMGAIAVIGSVAGDRGRKSNYVYGAAKGAVAIFLQGLRHRMASKGVRVVTIKPGFVDTPMTAAFENKGALWASPTTIAAGIDRAVAKGKAEAYLPWFWWPIMAIIRNVPERIFVRTNL
ncbi:SDR family oxidoreductase [Futiania mangrovi]|uniref:SDR family oxidoreductase n=1 Tax=Futiania mangrovi TaxID=2959716 RepID=A0A9J6PB47_9PROT|nr:SDR family oxidoreductase [Futiania mangrovii]MCP1336381.1 SDR family oxidoreductase [Futiania mangrovii]